jgi:hypothetical protein
VASISADPANSIEELIKLSMQRLQSQPKTVPPPSSSAAAIPDDLERVLRYLEALDIGRLGSAADAFAKRLKKVAKAIQNRNG